MKEFFDPIDLLFAATVKGVLNDVDEKIGEDVSYKSDPGICMKPLATRRALKR